MRLKNITFVKGMHINDNNVILFEMRMHIIYFKIHILYNGRRTLMTLK